MNAEPLVQKKRGRSAKAKVVPEYIDGLLAGRPVEHIPLDRINLADTTYRFRVGLRVKDLVDSIKQNGQQMPVVLRRRDGEQKLQVISGFRRLTALSQIGWTKATAVVLDDMDDERVFRLSVLENEKRKTYSDLDRAYAITKYRQMGYKVGDIAKDLFGLSRRQVERLQKLTDLPEVVQEAISNDAISTTLAVVLKQLHDKHGAKAVDLAYWVKRASAEQLSVVQVKKAIKKHLTDAGERTPPSLFRTVKDKKSGATVFRLNPLLIAPHAMVRDERERTAAELRHLLGLVEAVPA